MACRDATLLALALALTWPACDADTRGEGGSVLPALSIAGVAPSPLLPGTRLQITARGVLPAALATYELRFEGGVDGIPFGGPVLYVATPTGDGALEATIDMRLIGAVAGDSGRFMGALVLERTMDTGEVDEARYAVDLPLARVITPVLDDVPVTEIFPGDQVPVLGSGFLSGAEGVTLLRFDGVMTTPQPARQQAIDNLVVPLSVASTDRGRAQLLLTPDIFGVRPGRFEGAVRVINQHADGEVRETAPLTLRLQLFPPVISQVTPLEASRGQRVFVSGRGLLPADGLLQASTLLLLEGVWTPRRGIQAVFEGPDALVIFPDQHRGNVELSAALRVEVDEAGVLSGLGATAGVFDGRMTPLLLSGPDAIEGPPFPLAFIIVNPRQIVWIRYLPSFAEALLAFGVLAEREAVQRRVLEAVNRDYAGVNVVFVDAEPVDYAEFGIVEVGGSDPNGSQLFGLDNTAGKDVGNLRFDDVIGGFNAETRARNFAAYGGIFVTELLNLSPTLADHELASPRFDDIFGAVVPGLGGAPAAVGESDRFDARGAAITKAVRVLGNLVASTITHEVGHSLGLTAEDGRIHNDGDNPGWIMDAGRFRPFAERAEIDGQGPAVFSPMNRAYLENVLPLDPQARP